MLLKLDRMDNPAAIAVIDSEIDKINERLIERTGEYNKLTTTPYNAFSTTPHRRGGTPASATRQS